MTKRMQKNSWIKVQEAESHFEALKGNLSKCNTSNYVATYILQTLSYLDDWNTL